jgi:hypothetical protein
MILRSCASLRIFGDDLDPDEVTRALGAQPTGVARKGQRGRLPSGREGLASTGSWFLAGKIRSPGDLDADIRELLGRIEPDPAVWRDVAARHRCDVFCGLWMEEDTEGVSLAPDVLRLLGERGLLLDLDIYGPLRG